MKKRLLITSLFWKLFEQWGIKLIQFIIQVILARLLMPKDYGVIALVISFVTIANIFVDTGFSSALIQKKEADEYDFSSNFFESLAISTFLYIILFFTAPFIASFYNNDVLVLAIRVISISLFFGALTSTQYAIIARGLQFKKQFYIRILALPISALIGVFLAYKGYGVWALVTQYLVNQFTACIILFFSVKWKPKITFFSFNRIKQLFYFGWKILVSRLLETLYNNLNDLVIGKIAKAELLGFFNRGKTIPNLLMEGINGSIMSVMFPALSSVQDDKDKMKNLLRRSIITSCFFIFPMMIGLAVIARPIIIVLLTEKWLPALRYMQIYCFIYALWPILTANLQAINAIGRSDLSLKLAVIKRSIGVIILLLTIPYGILAISVGTFVSYFIATVINAYPNQKLLDYSYLDQIKDILPSLFISLLMGVMIYSLRFILFNVWWLLFTQIIFGVIIYLLLAKLFKMESYSYIKITINEFISKNEKYT